MVTFDFCHRVEEALMGKEHRLFKSEERMSCADASALFIRAQ
jgi:hypothetical protein